MTTLNRPLVLVLAACCLWFVFAPLRDAGGPLHWIQGFCTDTIGLVWMQVPGYLWLVPVLWTLALALLGTVSVLRQLVGARRVTAELVRTEVRRQPEVLMRIATRAGVNGRLRLVRSRDFMAFCSGLLFPQVWISTAVIDRLPADELEAILRHESWHVRRRDPLRVLFTNAVRSAFFFFPPVQAAARSYVTARELSADAATIRDMQDECPLASALYRAVEMGLARAPQQMAVGAFATLDARIDQLTGLANGEGFVRHRRLFGPLLAVVVAASSTIGLCLLFAA